MNRKIGSKNDPMKFIFGSKENILLLWLIFIAVAKIIRYTVLKTTLVDVGIGQRIMIDAINDHTTKFAVFSAENDAVDVLDAAGNAAFIFDKINFFGITTYGGFEIFITVIWNLLTIALFSKCRSSFGTSEALFVIMSIFALNIFDFTLAKEPIQFLFFFAVFYILESKRGNVFKSVLTFAIILLSVAIFRMYYILMLFWAILFLLLKRYIIKDRQNFFTLILSFMLAAASYYFMLRFLRQASPSTYDELIRVRTRKNDATTDIQPLFSVTSLTPFCINYFIMIFRLLFPIELIKFGPKYGVYVICQLVISFIYVRGFFRLKKSSYEKTVAVSLFTGFLLMSAVFEPDFGSWIRHEIATFPVILIFSGLMPEKSNNSINKLQRG